MPHPPAPYCQISTLWNSVSIMQHGTKTRGSVKAAASASARKAKAAASAPLGGPHGAGGGTRISHKAERCVAVLVRSRRGVVRSRRATPLCYSRWRPRFGSSNAALSIGYVSSAVRLNPPTQQQGPEESVDAGGRGSVARRFCFSGYPCRNTFAHIVLLPLRVLFVGIMCDAEPDVLPFDRGRKPRGRGTFSRAGSAVRS